MIRKAFVAAAGAVAFLASAGLASAATLTINSVTGAWQNDVPDAAVTGEGTNTISWGEPATNAGQSSYVFNGAFPPAAAVNEGVAFNLGTFTHNNFPVFPPTLTSVDLVVTIDIDGIGPIDSVFSFTHEETDNISGTCAYPSIEPCSDKVTAVLNLGETDVFEIMGVEYVFTINGFETSPGNLLEFFITQENQSNSAQLVGSFVTRASVIPLPATAWMLLAGMGALAMAARRRRAA